MAALISSTSSLYASKRPLGASSIINLDLVPEPVGSETFEMVALTKPDVSLNKGRLPRSAENVSVYSILTPSIFKVKLNIRINIIQ